jgi:hypothetical protein
MKQKLILAEVIALDFVLIAIREEKNKWMP